MDYTVWQTGMALDSPVYLDANVLIGATVTAHRLYKKTAQLVGELLANQASILLSLLAVEESLWALARLSYCELARQPPNAHFSQSVYERWRDRIFEAHSPRMEAIGAMLGDWSDAGVAVEVVPKTDPDFLVVSGLTPKYMRQYRLTPADAAHLAIAEVHARSFVTADSGFRDVARQAASQPVALTVVHLVP